ncbi:hypothetical protein QOT17_000582 [Balamuthia mandrillaris]
MLLNQQQGLFGDKENLVNQQKTLTKEHEALYEKLSDLRQQLRATSPRNTTGTDCGTVFTSSSLEAHFSNLHVSPPSLLEKGKGERSLLLSYFTYLFPFPSPNLPTTLSFSLHL